MIVATGREGSGLLTSGGVLLLDRGYYSTVRDGEWYPCLALLGLTK